MRLQIAAFGFENCSQQTLLLDITEKWLSYRHDLKLSI